MELDFIYRRRSIRKFHPNPKISNADFQELLTAAMSAPSACAKDPWRFYVVRQPAMLEQIAAALPNGKFLPQAGNGIVVCGDLDRAHGNELSYMLQDCSAAIENLLLAAGVKGFGACWLGVHPREERVAALSRILKLSDKVIPLAVIAIGVPAEHQPPRNRYRAEAVQFID